MTTTTRSRILSDSAPGTHCECCAVGDGLPAPEIVPATYRVSVVAADFDGLNCGPDEDFEADMCVGCAALSIPSLRAA